ncbi:MAG TPA: NUDIX domain-containing protein [Candidatus Saccharimonadales bacterium]|nr:NUDIX domain-containing protein [Candidatus Saccharimonadales bacterium]
MGHIHELIDFTVSAYIVHENRILLLEHKKLHTWLQPGGHIELHEHPEEAIWRELKEETGLERKNLRMISTLRARPPISADAVSIPVPFDINMHNFNKTHKHIDLAYLMVSNTAKVAPQADESTKLQWFTKAELETMRPALLEGVYSRCLFALDYLKAARQLPDEPNV